MGLPPLSQRKNGKLFKSHKGSKKQQSLGLTDAAGGVRKEFEKTLKWGEGDGRIPDGPGPRTNVAASLAACSVFAQVPPEQQGMNFADKHLQP